MTVAQFLDETFFFDLVRLAERQTRVMGVGDAATTTTNVRTHTRALTAQLHDVANDISIPLDGAFSAVWKTEKGTYCITATACEIPPTEEERSLRVGALHAAILDTFGSVLPFPMIYVHVPAVLGPYPFAWANGSAFNDNACTVSTWTIEQNANIRDLYAHMTLIHVHNVYDRLIDSYPWRDVDVLRLRVAAAKETARQRIVNNPRNLDPAEVLGDVDAILPPMSSLITPYDCDFVTREVARCLKRPPGSLVETYEVVYLICRTRHESVSISFRNLASALFVAIV